MVILIIPTTIVGAALVASVVMAHRDDWESWMVPTMLFVVAFTLTALVATKASHNIDKSNCAKFGRNAGYEVKFVNYNSFTWDCLVHINDQWVSKNNIRLIEQR